MRESLRISVILPILNESELVADAIQSARAASADEIIVVDGGSLDDSIEIAKNLRCTVVESPPGRGTQQNRGATLSSGDLLLFLHADCQLDGDCLNQVRQAVTLERAVWGGFQQRIANRQRAYRWLEKGNLWRANVRRLVYGDQGIWVKRELFESVQGFPDQPLMEDVSLSDKLRRIARPAMLPGPISVSPRRWQQRGIVRQTTKNWLLFGLFRLGVSPRRLTKFYRAK